MALTEKVAYIKGLADGLDLQETKENKVLGLIIDLLEDMAEEIGELDRDCGTLAEDIEALDEDLANLEEDFYGDEDECDCHCHGDDEDEILYEVECPSCKQSITVDEDLLCEGEIDCPNCGEKLEFDLDSIIEQDGDEDDGDDDDRH